MTLDVAVFAAVGACALVAGVYSVAAPLAADAWRGLGSRRGRIVGLLFTAGLAGALFLRPHEDSISGLDTSGYRHMTKAFAMRRGFHEVDRALLAVPEEIRPAFMLLPTMQWRNTRDRSFLVHSLEHAETEPFFYPLAPSAAALAELLFEGGGDFVLPALCAVLFGVLLLHASASAGLLGAALFAALVVASPLPVWFLRGYVPEGLASLLAAGAALRLPTDRASALTSSFALGLAVSLHPLASLLAMPVFLIRFLRAPHRRHQLYGWVAGLVPLVVMTAWICQPYGDLFDPSIWRRNLHRVAEHRALVAFLTVAALLCAAAAVASVAVGAAGWRSKGSAAPVAIRTWGESALAKAILASLPLLVMLVLAVLPSGRSALWNGLLDAWSALRLPGVTLLGGASVLVLIKKRLDQRWPVALGLAAFVVCCFLKGVEVSGLWHQRRLLPAILFLAVAAMPAAAVLKSAVDGLSRFSGLLTGALAMLVLGLGVANALRWPAPYVVRNEAGAQNWIRRVSEAIGDSLTLFDYHSFSLQHAVVSTRPVYGLGEHERAREQLPEIIRWLAGQASSRTVLVVTAYANPGIEQGLVFRSHGSITGRMIRVRSKRALPAETNLRDLAVEVLEARPPNNELPRLSKVFDGGWLALRGPWVPRVNRIRSPQGDRVPGQWFQNGAAIIGPVAAAGEQLHVRVVGVSGRRDERAVQRITLVREDGVEIGPFELAHSWSEASAVVAGAGPPSSRTMAYALRAESPYDPSTEGISDYPAGLGALLHRIDMWVEPLQTASDE